MLPILESDPIAKETSLISAPVTSHNDEIEFITMVQKKILELGSNEVIIQKGKSRELKDLYLYKGGECYDRSRSIEKILNYFGFKTRHIFLFTKNSNGSSASCFIPSLIFSFA